MLKHEHFGRLRPHYHTSYAGLVFALFVTGVLLLGASLSGAWAAAPAVNPQSGSVGLTGTVRGPAPSTAAVILAPSNGARFSATPITIMGTCPAGTFVTVERNNVFAGAVTCESNGRFSLSADLFAGANTLVARVSDALGQYGPNSTPVTVYYDAPSLALPSGSIGKQLFLNMTNTIVGGSPGTPITRTVTIVGGVGPYAVSWEFGDDATKLSSETSEGPVSTAHSYDRPGIYRVIVQVTDSVGNSAFLQFVTVVNGPAEQVGANNGSGLGAFPGMLLAWPVYLFAGVMVAAFWLGERRELQKLRRRHLVLN